MKQLNSYQYKAIYLATVFITFLAVSDLHAEEPLPASRAISETTIEFLSDPARTGSLLGSILAGSALANPLAPILGSVAGFMIGKSSAFTHEGGTNMRPIVAINRSLSPEDGEDLPSLTGLTGLPTQSSEHSVSFGISDKTEMPQGSGVSQTTESTVQSELSTPTINSGSTEKSTAKDQTAQTMRLEQPVIVPIYGETGIADRPDQTDRTVTFGLKGNQDTGGDVQKELARACSNVQTAQPMPLICYYYSK